MRSRGHRHRRFATPFREPTDDDSMHPNEWTREPGRKPGNRKAQQLCAQVAETLSFVLAECNDDILRDLLVESVVPAPDSTRLLVTVMPSAGADRLDPSQVHEHLHQAHGKLRSEVAMAIHRRKVPELVFGVRL